MFTLVFEDTAECWAAAEVAFEALWVACWAATVVALDELKE